VIYIPSILYRLRNKAVLADEGYQRYEDTLIYDKVDGGAAFWSTFLEIILKTPKRLEA